MQRRQAAQERIATLLRPFAAPELEWLPAAIGPESGFRNNAKMVVTGTAQHPVLGIRGPAGQGIDLRDCPLYPAAIHTVLAHIPGLITRAQIAPYQVDKRRGELKYVLVSVSDRGELMVRFVLRSQLPVARLREHLPQLLVAVPAVKVVSVNINPAHTAIIEGPEEIHLYGDQTLAIRQGDVTLQARPQSFVQTNTVVAGSLYRQVADWVNSSEPDVVWDLFCGIGGFAAHVAAPGRQVVGVEINAAAIAAATLAESTGTVEFIAADAARWAQAELAAGRSPDLLIVNPPRRGLGEQMAELIAGSGIAELIYSSCNPNSLARDLARMPGHQIIAARYVDMFPHSTHAEVVVRLVRSA